MPTDLVPYTTSTIRLETFESVCAGYSDKVCDRIADEILDAYFWEDPALRYAVATMTSNHRCDQGFPARSLLTAHEICARLDQARALRNYTRATYNGGCIKSARVNGAIGGLTRYAVANLSHLKTKVF